MYDPADAESVPEGTVPTDPYYRQMWIESQCLKYMIPADGVASSIRNLIGIESQITAREIQDVIDASEELSHSQKSCQDFLEGALILNWAKQGREGSYVAASKLLEKMSPNKFGKNAEEQTGGFGKPSEPAIKKNALTQVTGIEIPEKKEPEE